MTPCWECVKTCTVRSWSCEHSLPPYYNSSLCKTAGPCVNRLHLIRIRAVPPLWTQHSELDKRQRQKKKGSFCNAFPVTHFIMESKPIRTPINKCTHIIAKTRHPLNLFVYMSLLLFSFLSSHCLLQLCPLKSSIHLLWKWMCHPHLSHWNYANDRQH